MPARSLRLRLSRFALIPALAVVLITGFAAGWGYKAAGANSSADTVEACVSRYTGAVRMNGGNAPINCSSGEIKRTWDGHDPAGLTDIYFAAAEQTFVNNTSFGMAAECPDGWSVIAGGAQMNNSAFHLVNSYPDYEGNKWTATAATAGAASQVSARVFAVCAMFGS